MRRRLILVSGAVTAMVVLAFLVPLMTLVGDLAIDRAVNIAQNEANQIAQLIALRAPGAPVEETVESIVLDRYDYPASIVVVGPNDEPREVLGAPIPEGENLTAAEGGASFRTRVPGGQAIYAPVLLPSEPTSVIVRVFVAEEELTAGVARSRTILALLGAALVAIAVFVSDRLGRSMVEPVRALSATAAVLGQGNLDARVTPAGPPEVQEVALELNDLAGRITRLLRLEREAAADLSHRLRTPLTAVRLDVEALANGAAKDRLLEDLDQLDRTVDFVIREARRPARTDAARRCDLAAVASERAEFWSVLAEEQSRKLEYMSDGAPTPIGVGADDATAMIDALIGNVFAHTDEGTNFTVAVASLHNDQVMLVVDDEGPGFTAALAERGLSEGGSTGLGLDIARRTAESAGGILEIGETPTGGGRVAVTLPRL